MLLQMTTRRFSIDYSWYSKLLVAVRLSARTAEREDVSDDPITMRRVPFVRISSTLRPTPALIDLVGNVKNQPASLFDSQISIPKCSLNNQSSTFGEICPCSIDGSRQIIRYALPRRCGFLQEFAKRIAFSGVSLDSIIPRDRLGCPARSLCEGREPELIH